MTKPKLTARQAMFVSEFLASITVADLSDF